MRSNKGSVCASPRRRRTRRQRPLRNRGPGSGQKLNLADPVPCDMPVDGAELANEIAKIKRQFVVLGEQEVDAIVLWVFFTHLIDVFEIAP